MSRITKPSGRRGLWISALLLVWYTSASLPLTGHRAGGAAVKSSAPPIASSLPAVQSPAVVVSAATYSTTVAGYGIISIFGTGLASVSASATGPRLPLTLGGVRVRIVPVSNTSGLEEVLPLFFVSERQINCLLTRCPAPAVCIPPVGPSTLTVENNGVIVATIACSPDRIAPGVFTADMTGAGYPAALVLRARADGAQIYEPVFTRDSTGKIVASPIDLGPDTDELFLVLYTTGVIGWGVGYTLSDGVATIDGIPAETQYLGSAPNGLQFFEGLQQINLRIPRSLKGVNRDVDVRFTMYGIPANVVKINIR